MCAAQIRGTDSLQLGGALCVCVCVFPRLTSLDILTRLMRDQRRTIENFHADSAAAAALPRWDEAREARAEEIVANQTGSDKARNSDGILGRRKKKKKREKNPQPSPASYRTFVLHADPGPTAVLSPPASHPIRAVKSCLTCGPPVLSALARHL